MKLLAMSQHQTETTITHIWLLQHECERARISLYRHNFQGQDYDTCSDGKFTYYRMTAIGTSHLN